MYKVSTASYRTIKNSTKCHAYSVSYKSGDKKTVKREGIEPIGRVFTYVTFSVTHSL